MFLRFIFLLGTFTIAGFGQCKPGWDALLGHLTGCASVSSLAAVTATINTAGSTCTTTGGAGTESCTASPTAGTAGAAGAVITHNFTSGTNVPWVTCGDSSGNEMGGLTASVSVTDVIATSTNVVTVTFSGATGAGAKCRVSNAQQGPQGVAGPTGASGGGTGTVNSGSNPQMAQYVGAGSTVVGGVTISGDATVANGGALTIAANAVTSSKSAVVNTRRVCNIIIGADNGTALGTADIAPQARQCYVPAASHIVEIDVAADAGTPAVVVAVNHAGVLTSLNASLATGSAGALACVNVAGSGTGIDGATTCGAALSATTAAAGDWFETRTSATASTAKRMSIAIIYLID